MMTTSDANGPSSATMDDVLSAIGAEFYSFTSPRDLVSLSRTSRFFAEDVRQNLILVWSRQQQLRNSCHGDDDESAAASVVISKEHSFAKKEELAECLLDKINMSNLRLSLPNCSALLSTLDETLAHTKADLADESSWSGDAWVRNFANDPADIWKPFTQGFIVSCSFQKDLQKGYNGRKCFIDFMLRKLGQQDEDNASGGVDQVTRDWARYLLAQKDIVGREWKVKCDGVEEVGFMIYTPKGAQRLEIKLTKRAIEHKPTTFQATPPPSLLSSFGF